MSSDGHLKAVFDNQSIAKSVQRQLLRLANSFDEVGNEKMAETLYDISEKIMKQADHLVNTFMDRQAEQLRKSQEHMGDILTALIAGVEIGENSH